MQFIARFMQAHVKSDGGFPTDACVTEEQKQHALNINQTFYKVWCSSGKTCNKWKEAYIPQPRPKSKTTLGMNAIGHSIQVKGWAKGDRTTETRGVIMSTTCTGWATKKKRIVMLGR